ncbi:MAG TPA: TonB-dependent receptor [Terracidiphilus sp.]
MGRAAHGAMAAWLCVAAAAFAQNPPLPPAAVHTTESAAAVSGGKLHGVVKSGSVPLPGVTVTAQNTLSGKRFSTVTDVTGAWSMNLPQNGRYVVRTQFAGFAQGAGEALLNAQNHDQAVNLDLMLASRAAQQQQQEGAQSDPAAQAVRQMAANGPQALSLMNAMTGASQAGDVTGNGTAAGAALPSIAGNADFAGESVTVSGQAGQVSPLAGVDMDRLRDSMETMRSQFGGEGGGGLFGGGAGGGGSGGGAGGFGGGPGGFGGSGGGRMNFINFKPGQPHGSVYWTGSNSALNAQPFSLRGQQQQQPASGTNNFGISFMGSPYIPGLTKPSGKDNIFLNVTGSRNSNPVDQYATVPTAAERAGDIPGLSSPVTPVPEAQALLNYIPLPNLPGETQNYHLLTTQQSNSTRAGVRYMRGIGANATPFGMGGRGNRTQTQGLRQSVNFNYNWAHLASDNVNIEPILGGKNATDSNSVQAGYTLGKGKLTSIFNASWNRNDARIRNYFTSTTDIATQLGILGPDGTALNASPLNWGLPSVTLSSYSGISQVQPSLSVQQTISLSETLAWIHGKHNFRFGGDYRRVHRDILGGSNATGTFYFTGYYTGSALGDFLLGQAQQTSIAAAESKSYLRDNVFDLYAQDDWRVKPGVTLLLGVRYEHFSPYTEKYNRLSMVDTNPDFGFTDVAQVNAGEVSANYGALPDSLVHPYGLALAPRLGIAWRVPKMKQTVVRAGYGMNYTVNEYATFAQSMAYQPPFANEQTNSATQSCPDPAVACYTLANGFPAPDAIGNYAVDPHYRLPYVQVWNVDVQKTLPWGVVLNAGYNGSKGSNLDVKIAPWATPSSSLTNPDHVPFYFEKYGASSRFNAGTLRVNKRLSSGIAVGANYQYSHSIDDAGSVGGTGSVVAQNWQDIEADMGNSAFDVRHKVSGNYLYELPFGKDKFYFTTGRMSHALEGFSIAGAFTFATGTPLTPTLQASQSDVGRAVTGTGRLDRVPGASLTQGGGSLKQWFNTSAFTPPVPDAYGNSFGTASRNLIPGPGTVQNNMSLSKTMQLGETRSMEIRATANNVFNTVQYTGVDTTYATSHDANVANGFGQVTSTGSMRSFQFVARYRF